MTPKRKKRKPITEKESTPIIKKRRKMSAVDISDICQDIFEILKSHKDANGRTPYSSFVRSPNRRSCPEYYELVKNSIDFTRIQIKLKAGEFDTINKFSKDISLLMSNSLMYYSSLEGSHDEISDVMKLQQVYATNLLILADEEYSIISVEDIESKQEVKVEKVEKMEVKVEIPIPEYEERYDIINKLVLKVLNQIMKYQEFGRNVCENFMELPIKKEFKDYYDTISNPIDLKTIGKRVEDNKYDTFLDFAEDIMLLVENAKLYNKANTKIFRDANAIRKIIDARKFQLDPTYKPKITNSRYKPNHKEYLKNKEAELDKDEICLLFHNLRHGIVDLTEESSDDEEEDEDDDDDEEINGDRELRKVIKDEEESSPRRGRIRKPTSDLNDDSRIDDDESFSSEKKSNEPENIYLRLYGHIKRLKDIEGSHISDMFTKLPTKKELPDYYEEILKPMCLNKVRRRIAEKRYLCFNDCYEDLKLIFINAKSYNVDDCDIYKNAVILENELNYRYNELLPLDIESDLTSSRKSLSPKRKAYESSRQSTATFAVIQGSEEALKKKLLTLYKHIIDCQEGDRKLCSLLQTLPSSIEHPSYYKCVKDPIDLVTIHNRIKSNKYNSIEDFTLDMELMFSNAFLYYSEEGKEFKDCKLLHAEFNARLIEMPPLDISQRNALLLKSPLKIRQKRSSMARCLKEYFDGLKNFKLTSGRNMSAPFISLPLRADYPDYYDVIKKPIDIQRIGISLSSGKYHNLDDMLNDFLLMFDNACKYNEPESMIYKDALKLQHYCIKIRNKLMLLCDDHHLIPDYKIIVNEMMDKCLISAVEATNEYGRYYYDSQYSITTANTTIDENSNDSADYKEVSFQQIRYNVDKKRYKRFDRFQTDFYTALDKGKSFDAHSQIYIDTVEMQKRFILRRDDLFVKGDRFTTPAQIYNFHLLEDEIELKQKNDKKKKHDTEVDLEDNKILENLQYERIQSTKYNDRIFTIGDFIYVEYEQQPKRRIVSIAKLWKTKDGDVYFRGSEFVYAKDTNLSKYRRFLSNEVFKTATSECLLFNDNIARCHVMYIKDYLKCKPRDFCDEDIFVCESSYSFDNNISEDILNWTEPHNSGVFIQNRENSFRVKRAALEEFKSGDICSESGYITNNLINTTLSNQYITDDNKSNSDTSNRTSFEQYVLPQGVFKLGDFVSTKAKLEKEIAFYRIDKIWTEKENQPFFEGICFLFPEKIEHSVNRIFYEKEIIQISCSMDEIKLPPVDCKQIKGMVSILSYKEYCNQRHTEIPESEVFICDYKYSAQSAADQKLRKNKPLKKQLLTMRVLEDEIYVFHKSITPLKIVSPFLLKTAQGDGYSMDDNTSNTTANAETVPDPEVTESTKKKKVKRFVISGYIVFAGKSRKQIIKDNSDLTFGEISKLVGQKWRSLNKVERSSYENRAKKILSEHSKRQILVDAGISGENVPLSPSHQGEFPRQAEQVQPPPPYKYNQQMPHPSAINTAMYPPQPPMETPIHPPYFVGVPVKSHRNLQSYAYMTYMEGLSNNARDISDWRNTLSANQTNSMINTKLPTHFLNEKDPQVNERSLSDGLWLLRDQLKNDTFTVARNIPFEYL